MVEASETAAVPRNGHTVAAETAETISPTGLTQTCGTPWRSVLLHGKNTKLEEEAWGKKKRRKKKGDENQGKLIQIQETCAKCQGKRHNPPRSSAPATVHRPSLSGACPGTMCAARDPPSRGRGADRKRAVLSPWVRRGRQSPRLVKARVAGKDALRGSSYWMLSFAGRSVAASLYFSRLAVSTS